MATHEILLFYKYVDIADPHLLMREQRALCERLGLTGRMILATEGINATLEGLKDNTDAYCEVMKADPRFSDIHFKKSDGTGKAFPRLSIKVRKDIVSNSFGELVKVDPRTTTGKRLSPEELHEWFQKKPDSFYIIDMRNDYEFRVGRFKNSLHPGLKNFRDLPQKLEEIAHLKDKVVLPVCTGGVRCEKASGYLVQQGFKDVYQLDGGIVSYMEKYPGQDFEGGLYVFDNRHVMHFDDPATHKAIGTCDLCGASSESYVDCHLNTCHQHFICCEECQKGQGELIFCSEKCRTTHHATEGAKKTLAS